MLTRATVVSGHKSLEREITWVHIVDHPDVAPWRRPGQLLLSSGYQWPRGDEELTAFVDGVARAGIVGIVLAVPHLTMCRLP